MIYDNLLPSRLKKQNGITIGLHQACKYFYNDQRPTSTYIRKLSRVTRTERIIRIICRIIPGDYGGRIGWQKSCQCARASLHSAKKDRRGWSKVFERGNRGEHWLRAFLRVRQIGFSNLHDRSTSLAGYAYQRTHAIAALNIPKPSAHAAVVSERFQNRSSNPAGYGGTRTSTYADATGF